jgi:hypothetical protein
MDIAADAVRRATAPAGSARGVEAAGRRALVVHPNLPYLPELASSTARLLFMSKSGKL